VAEHEPLQVLIFLPLLTCPIPQRIKPFVGSNTLEKHVLHCPFPEASHDQQRIHLMYYSLQPP
jgi:hypothetical protein